MMNLAQHHRELAHLGAYDMLESLIPAIEGIDHGCSYCIGSFIEHANKIFVEEGRPYEFDYVNLAGPDDTITIENVVGEPISIPKTDIHVVLRMKV